MQVFSANYHTIPRSQQLAARVKAKAELWAFLHEITPELNDLNGTQEELAKEITQTTIRILHPHFTGIDLLKEVENVLDTLGIEKPANLIECQAEALSGIVKAQLKQRLAGK